MNKLISSSNLKRLINLLSYFTKLLNENNVNYYIFDNILKGYLLNKGLLCNIETNYTIVIIKNDNFKIEDINDVLRYSCHDEKIYDYYTKNIFINIRFDDNDKVELEKCYLFNDDNFIVYKRVEDLDIDLNIKYNIEYFYINHSIKIYKKYFKSEDKVIINTEKIRITPEFIDNVLNKDIEFNNINDELKNDVYNKIKLIVKNDVYEKVINKLN